MNLYNVRIKHLGTGLIYIQQVLAKDIIQAKEKANMDLAYCAIDAVLIRTNAY